TSCRSRRRGRRPPGRIRAPRGGWRPRHTRRGPRRASRRARRKPGRRGSHRARPAPRLRAARAPAGGGRVTDGLFGALRGRVLRGLVWKGGSSMARQLLRIGVMVVLARLLSPHDYGVAGMVLVFASLVEIFGDLALGAALVQRDKLSDDDRLTAFWISIGAG